MRVLAASLRTSRMIRPAGMARFARPDRTNMPGSATRGSRVQHHAAGNFRKIFSATLPVGYEQRICAINDCEERLIRLGVNGSSIACLEIRSAMSDPTSSWLRFNTAAARAGILAYGVVHFSTQTTPDQDADD